MIAGVVSLVLTVAVLALLGIGLIRASDAIEERITGRPTAPRALELERLRLEKEAEIELAVLRDRIERQETDTG